MFEESESSNRQLPSDLLAASLSEDTEELEFATWRVLRLIDQPWVDPADPVNALWDASIVLRERGRTQAALGARDAAARLARRVLSAFSPENATTLTARLGPAAEYQLRARIDAM